MKTLDNVEVGDMVVIAPMHSYGPYRIVRIDKVTKTQLTADGTRFNRRNGVRVGDGNNWSHRIKLAFGNQWRTLMTPDEAEAKNQEIKDEKEHSRIITVFLNLRRSEIEKVSTENLRAALELLGVKE